MKSKFAYLIIIAFGALLFVPNLGRVHLYDWDEINFAECAREMLVSNNFWQVQIDFLPFWEKPPFFIWLQALSMKLFGMNEVGARFPNAMIGISTLLIIYYIGKRFRDQTFAFTWTFIYAISILPHVYFKSGIIDPSFNLLIFLAIFFYNSSLHRSRKTYYAILCGISLGLAFITKGPVAILLFTITVLLFFMVIKAWKKWQWSKQLIVIIACLFVACIWILPNLFMGGFSLFQDFIAYQIRLFQTQDAGHGGPFFYHFIVLLIGCFPMSLFLFQKNKIKLSINSSERDFHAFMIILFSVTLFIFSIVHTKIIHYSSLCYFPLSYLAAHSFSNLWQKNNKANRVFRYSFLTMGVLLGLVVCLIPFVLLRKDEWIHLVKDEFAVQNLQAAVSWHWTDGLPGLMLVLATLMGFHLFSNRKHLRALVISGIGLLIFIEWSLFIFPKKIEAISQGAAIEFIKQHKAYKVDPKGYKSFAHLFYGQRKTNYSSNEKYVVMKEPYWKNYPEQVNYDLIEIKNGYVFLKHKE